MVLTTLKSNLNYPVIVCLCGSTRFKAQFEEANFQETMKGHIVLSVGFYHHSGGYMPTAEEKIMLDILHMQKIDLADEILVINVDGYVGESTTREVQYAWKMGKIIRWMFPDNVPPMFMAFTRTCLNDL